MSSVKDKVAIVTGASSGLGEAIAVMLASRGAMVALCGRDQTKLDAVLEKCLEDKNSQKDRLITISGDINDGNLRKQIIAKTVEKYGRIDILVPNAGMALPQSGVETATEETYDLVMNTNLKSVFFLTQDAIPHLEKSKGSIVMMSSLYSEVPGTNQAIYAISKAGLDHYTRCLALTLGPKGIRANAVNPSLIPTQVFRHFGAVDKVEELVQKLIEGEKDKNPLGRFGTAEEVAELVVFLASEAASFITGQCIQIDGGRHFLRS